MFRCTDNTAYSFDATATVDDNCSYGLVYYLDSAMATVMSKWEPCSSSAPAGCPLDWRLQRRIQQCTQEHQEQVLALTTTAMG